MKNHKHSTEQNVAPPTAARTLDAYFLELRSRILDVAAILDRIGRGSGKPPDDMRLSRIHEALQALLREQEGRAELIQQIFSLSYDPAWTPPEPR